MKLSALFVAAVGVFASVEGTTTLRRAAALAEDHEQSVLDASTALAALARPTAECKKANKDRKIEAVKAKGDREACTACPKDSRKAGTCAKSGSSFVCKGADGKSRNAFGYDECTKDGDKCNGCDAPTAGYCLWIPKKGAKKEHWKCATDAEWPSSASDAELPSVASDAVIAHL